jgi:hypothetical protein
MDKNVIWAAIWGSACAGSGLLCLQYLGETKIIETAKDLKSAWSGKKN